MFADAFDSSGNGSTKHNGKHAPLSTDTPPPSGRDARGRSKGNPGGNGIFFARRTAAFHRAFCSVVSEEDIRAIALKLKEQALAGDLAAIELLLSYRLSSLPTLPR